MAYGTEQIVMGIAALVTLWVGWTSTSIGHARKGAAVVWFLYFLVTFFVFAELPNDPERIGVLLGRMIGFCLFAMLGYGAYRMFARLRGVSARSLVDRLAPLLLRLNSIGDRDHLKPQFRELARPHV